MSHSVNNKHVLDYNQNTLVDNIGEEDDVIEDAVDIGEDDDGKTNKARTIVRDPYHLRRIRNTKTAGELEMTYQEEQENRTIENKYKRRRSSSKKVIKNDKKGTSNTVKKTSGSKSNPLSSKSVPDDDDDGDANDIQPIQINEDITFSDIGGLKAYIDELKDMIFFPLVYPEFFTHFQTNQSRGVLFCGPPGTGKTLVARALACSVSKVAGQKVSFYMRKGADLMSKWVGESEKQLKLLFEAAQKNQPSIIFFDEIDGIAPIRSSKQDQAHNSVVSTLLALMDGLDSRGQVILIGATNRIDSIDPALRRPGRFDREFTFLMPDCSARAEILDIHTRNWNHPPSKDFKSELASLCVGYCGADLKTLCTEATIIAFGKKYPNVYTSNKKILIDVNSIKVKRRHFMQAMSKITPSSRRGILLHSHPLPLDVEPGLKRHLDKVMEKISNIFPFLEPSYQTRTRAFVGVSVVYKPQLLLCGSQGVGLEHLGPAILHKLENFPIHSLDFCNLESNENGLSFVQSLVNKFAEARKSAPCVLYLPRFHYWWDIAKPETRVTLLSLFEDLPSDSRILLLGTSSFSPDELDLKCSPLFPSYSIYKVEKPSSEDRSAFVSKMIKDVLSIQSSHGKGPKKDKRDSSLQLSTSSSEETAQSGSQKESNSNHNIKKRKRKSATFKEQLEEIKKSYVEQTKGYDITQLRNLYTDLMKSSIDQITKDHGREEDSVLKILHGLIPKNYDNV